MNWSVHFLVVGVIVVAVHIEGPTKVPEFHSAYSDPLNDIDIQYLGNHLSIFCIPSSNGDWWNGAGIVCTKIFLLLECIFSQ